MILTLLTTNAVLHYFISSGNEDLSDLEGDKDRERGFLSKKSKKMLYEVGYSEFAKARDDDRQSPRSSPELWDWSIVFWLGAFTPFACFFSIWTAHYSIAQLSFWQCLLQEAQLMPDNINCLGNSCFASYCFGINLFWKWGFSDELIILFAVRIMKMEEKER